MSGLVRAWAEEALSALADKGLLRALEPVEGPQGGTVRIAGARLINLSSNDYLGLAADPRLAVAAAEAARRLGVGSGASRLVVGDGPAHRSLEAALAESEGAEAALLFNSGYAANVGILTTLVGPGDAVFSDALNHASIVDGCRLSRAQVEIYPHLDVAALEERLARTPARRKLVVTDRVFSMDGDVAPLSELLRVCRAHQAALMVDEAHATGVLEKEPAAAEVDVRMGTLGKALGGFGAYVLCAAPVREWLFNRARSLVYSTSLPPPVCAAAERALRIVREEPERRARLWRNIEHFAQGLRALGLPAQARSAIFPLVLGTPERALSASAFLRERGVLAKAIRPPTVPAGTSRLRFALSAAHETEALDRALGALGQAISPIMAA
jgi:8-amino-7-oxononanoate synthase